MDNAIDVRELEFSFGEGELRNHVLKKVELQIGRGEIIIMTGPSGSGKTTLLTLIGALRRASEGSIRVFGQELVGAAENDFNRTRLSLGFIFQHHNLLNGLTALQNVCLSLELRSEYDECKRQEKGKAMLESVGLGDKFFSKPAQLSGGQKQRVSIARALVSTPKLVLADEPTASLDKVSGQETVNILKRLARDQGTTILLVTHDYRILDMADRVIELDDGKIRTVSM